MSLFWGLLGLSVLVAVLFETEVLPSGMWSEALSAEFICRCIMEVVALGGIWLALRLFRFQRIHADLVSRKEPALKKWGVLRLLLLELPMLLNTLLYYMYMQTTYGYLAIIALLTLPFVFPSLGRCTGDVTDDQPETAAPVESEEQQETEQS
jgi:ABC-type uncharacterized transport system YnjBCD permease subunit